MSDVPDLDRLIEEHENVKRNQAWDKRSRAFRRSTGVLLICVTLFLPAVCIFGDIGAILCALLLVFCLAPFLAAGLFDFVVSWFIDPPPKDPTKRYHYK